MKQPNKNLVKDISIDTGSAAIGAGIGMALGPAGAVVGAIISPVMADVLKRMLSKNQKDRIQEAAELAQEKIGEKINHGATIINKDFEKDFSKILEGGLLIAKDSYEDKKIPLISNLIATAPFTNTPTSNLIQTLKTTEELTYRQLCIISVIGVNQWPGGNQLSDKSFADKFRSQPGDEERDGIFFDVLNLISHGIIIQLENDNEHINTPSVVARIIPSKLRLYYPGTLLFNGLQLDTIDKSDLQPIIKALG